MKKWYELAKERMRTQRVTQEELAASLGVTQGAVAHWLSGRREPTLETISNILEYLGLSPMSLFSDKSTPSKQVESNAEYLGPIDAWDDDTPLDDDEVYVPFLKEVELSAGGGRTIVEQSHKQKLRFGKVTLRRQGVQPDHAVCVTVRGNSMEPVLPDGSTVGVDQGAGGVVDGKMYAIDHGGQLRVKTLFRLPGGGIRMRSFNRDDHPDEEYTTEQMDTKEILVVGRVFWSSALW